MDGPARLPTLRLKKRTDAGAEPPKESTAGEVRGNTPPARAARAGRAKGTTPPPRAPGAKPPGSSPPATGGGTLQLRLGLRAASAKGKTPPPRAPGASPDSPPPRIEGGMLQLKLGRAAHGYGLVAALGFVINSAFLYAATTSQFPTLPSQYADLFLWLIPLVVGALSAAFALATKWRPFGGIRSRGHMLMSATALVFCSMFTVAIFLRAYGAFPTLDPRVMYPVSVAGISLVLLSMASTWAGHSVRKVASMLAALAIPAIMVAGMAYTRTTDPFSGAPSVLLFVVMYFTLGLLAEASGSSLHILASSTAAAKREILVADDSKQAQIQAQLRELQKALTFRQDGLNRREAAIEAQETELRDEERKLVVQRKDLVATVANVSAREGALREMEGKLAAARGELDARADQLKMKESDAAQAAANLEEGKKALAARELAASELEKKAKRADVDVESAKRQAEARLKAAAEQEERAKGEEARLEKKRTELLKLEKDLQVRESQLSLRTDQAEATTATSEADRAHEMTDWQGKLNAKQQELAQLEVELRTLENQLKDRYYQATATERQVQDQRKQLVTKEQELVAREKAVSDREVTVDPERANLERANLERERKALQEQARRLSDKELQYTNLVKELRMKEASASTNQDEFAKRVTALDRRQKTMDEKDAKLQEEIRRLSEENRKLLQTKKELEQRDQELSLRHLELEQKRGLDARTVQSPGIKDTTRDQQLEMWEERLRQREEEFKRQMYQKEKQIELREHALKASIQTGLDEAGEEVVVAAKSTTKVTTGSPRLDDLLYGGISIPANFLVAGPAFAGKEVLLLSFIAEGLKKGVPAIIITTTKPPVDVARDMAPILPTFIEYEQLGLVYWIDCSQQTDGRIKREKTTCKVNGPTDFDNILSVLAEVDERYRAKYPYFRVAYLSLSSTITSSDPSAGIAFFQRLVNRFRQTKALVGYAVERGVHTDQQIEALEHLVDGAIHLRSEKQKTMLQVMGFGEVQTRDWVPYKFTNKAVVIGSFQLERIR